jgi:hypothetical protein
MKMNREQGGMSREQREKMNRAGAVRKKYLDTFEVTQYI